MANPKFYADALFLSLAHVPSAPIITELAVFEVDRVAGEMELTDIAAGVTVDEVRAKTGGDFKVRSSLGSF